MRTIRTKTQPQPVRVELESLDTSEMDPLANFIGEIKSPRKKSPNAPGSKRKEYVTDATERTRTKVWEGATVGTLVGLYWVCHLKVYGTIPTELDRASTWVLAMKSAGKLVKDQLDGDIQQGVKFLRWVWTREAEREDWRRKNDKSGRRITWQAQFCYVNLITDWRADKVRQGA